LNFIKIKKYELCKTTNRHDFITAIGCCSEEYANLGHIYFVIRLG